MRIHYLALSVYVIVFSFFSLIGIKQLVLASSTPFIYLPSSPSGSISTSGSITDTIPRNASGMVVPAIAMRYGKVNQHFDTGSMTRKTDPTGVRGAGYFATWGNIEGYGDRKLEYCQIFWPATIAVSPIGDVFINRFMTKRNLVAYASTKPAYECVLPGSWTAVNGTGNTATGAIHTGVSETLHYTLLPRYCAKDSNGIYKSCRVHTPLIKQIDKKISKMILSLEKQDKTVAEIHDALQYEVIAIENAMNHGITSQRKLFIYESVHNYLTKVYGLSSRIED